MTLRKSLNSAIFSYALCYCTHVSTTFSLLSEISSVTLTSGLPVITVSLRDRRPSAYLNTCDIIGFKLVDAVSLLLLFTVAKLKSWENEKSTIVVESVRSLSLVEPSSWLSKRWRFRCLGRSFRVVEGKWW
jgi:hypothetical protein